MPPFVKISVDDGKVFVKSPYHPRWPEQARAIGGSWHANTKLWVFDASRLDKVQALAVEVYGSDVPMEDELKALQAVKEDLLKQLAQVEARIAGAMNGDSDEALRARIASKLSK